MKLWKPSVQIRQKILKSLEKGYIRLQSDQSTGERGECTQNEKLYA